jgi:hypothetical protein
MAHGRHFIRAEADETIENWVKLDCLLRRGERPHRVPLRRYAHDELGWRERPTTVRVDDPLPGEEA